MTLSVLNLEGHFRCLKPYYPSFIKENITRIDYQVCICGLFSCNYFFRKWKNFQGYRQIRTLLKWQYVRNGAR